MKWKLCRNCILAATVLVLPGCLAINAALGVLSVLGSGPIQFAGTAYSISEYTYEYVVNDKTPDEVMVDKFAWLLLPEEELDMTEYAQASQDPVITDPIAAIAPEVQLAQETPDTAPSLTLAPVKLPKTLPIVTASLNPAPQKKAAAAKPERVQRQRRIVKRPTPAHAKMVTAKKAIPKPVPHHIYIEREADPLLAKLDKLEMNFRQAESIVSNAPSQGILLSAQAAPGATVDNGISGSWSIRHGLMERAPAGPRIPIIDAHVPAREALDIS